MCLCGKTGHLKSQHIFNMSVFDENCDFKIDFNGLESKLLCEFKSNVCHISKQITNQLDDFQAQDFNYTSSAGLNNDDELRIVTERNKKLVQEIKSKVEEYEKQQVQLKNYKSDQKLLTTEIKETHEAFLMAKKYYKKFLKIYFTIELSNDDKQGIYLQFFTDMKKESRNYSVHLLKDMKTKHYEVLQITPGLELCDEIQQKLVATGDVPGALCAIRQAFVKYKKSKTKSK